ncbi:isochorismate synthase [Chromatium weissei]|nr:isochorismate synthase [Chromatium weissei]
MLAPLKVLEQLRARLHETISLLPLDQADGFVSLILALPHALTIAPELPGPQFHFAHNHRDELRAGYGIAGEWLAEGAARLSTLGATVKAATANWQQFDPDETGFTGFGMLGFAAAPSDKSPQPPFAKGGISFDTLPNALFWLPELALCSQAGQAALILTTELPVKSDALLSRWLARLDAIVPLLAQPALDPLTSAHLERGASEPNFAVWRELVNTALHDIALARLEKVVIGRRLRLEGHRRFDLTRLSAALRYLFPSCQVINIRREASSFVAATPERLFTQHRDRIEADALAGTMRRAENAERDAAITLALLRCEKNLREHQVVVDAVTAALRQCCRQLDAPDGPRILQLNNAQHLWSILRGQLEPEVNVFRLAELLHPTPATNGQPRQAARAWLQQTEPLERGWYTGAAGIVAPNLTGELWVLLRCAQVNDRVADLYAGAGIVAGSDALSEWQETEHKLAAMLTALQFA